MPSRCSDKKLYARDTEGVWHVIVPDTGMCAYLRTADGQVVRVKGAAEVRRFAGGKDGEAVVIAAAEPPDPAMFDMVEPVAVREVHGTGQVKRAAWTAPEHDLYQRLVEGDQGERQRLTAAVEGRFDWNATGTGFGIGVGANKADVFPAGFLPADGSRSLVDAAVHAPLPDPDSRWDLGREGVDAVAAAAVLGLRQYGVPVAKSEQMMRRVRLIADAAEAGMLHRPDSIELDALLMSVHWHGPNRYGRTGKVDRLMLWLLGRDGDIELLDEATRLLEAAGSWQDDTSARMLDVPPHYNSFNWWRFWRTLLESAAAADPDMVDQMFGEDVKGWRKAVRWAAGLPVAWDDSDQSTAKACLFALMEGRPEGAPKVGPDLTAHGSPGPFRVPAAVDGFSTQQDRLYPLLDGLVAPEAYANLVALNQFFCVRGSLAYERNPEVIEATLSLLSPRDAIEVAPSGWVGRATAGVAVRIADEPFAADINAALEAAAWRWKHATSDGAIYDQDSPVRLDSEGLRRLADLVVGGLAAQAGGRGSGVLGSSGGQSVVRQVPFMLGDRDDALATGAAKAVLCHSDHDALAGRTQLHLLATPAGRRAFNGLTADEQDGLYDHIADGLAESGPQPQLPDLRDDLPVGTEVAVGGRITVADVFANSDTKQCVRAAAAAAVADGLDGDPADPDTHPDWADLLGDTPGGHKVALFATNAVERGDADERTVKEILGLAPFFRPSNRPV